MSCLVSSDSTLFSYLNSKEHSFSTIKVTFADSQIRKTSRYIIYKIERFIIDVGSCIGLFLGAALLIEAFLYICNVIIKKILKISHEREPQVAAENNNSFGRVEVIAMPEIRIINDQGEDLQIEDLE